MYTDVSYSFHAGVELLKQVIGIKCMNEHIESTVELQLSDHSLTNISIILGQFGQPT